MTFRDNKVSTSILSREGHVPLQGSIVNLLKESYKWWRVGHLSFVREACPEKEQKLSCQTETLYIRSEG